MATLDINLEWHLDLKGYRLVDNDRAIVANGGKMKHTRPLDGIDSLYKIFSDVRTPNELLKFVQVHGLLHSHSYKAPWITGVLEKSLEKKSQLGRYAREVADASVNLPKRESVSEHLETAELFRRIMRQAQQGWRSVPNSVALELSRRFHGASLGGIGLGDDIERGFRFTLTANTLMDGLWLQLARNIMAGAKFQSCAQCGLLFETGPRTGRRAKAKFCSDRHRIEFNSRKRTKSE